MDKLHKDLVELKELTGKLVKIFSECNNKEDNNASQDTRTTRQTCPCPREGTGNQESER